MSIELSDSSGAAVQFSDIIDEFKALHDQGKEYNRWGLFNLETAAKEFGQTWVRRALSTEEVMGIVLPSHWHPRTEGVQLVPKEGMTVEEVAKRFAKLSDYQVTNPSCAQRISYLRDSSSPFYLSAQPIPSGDYLELGRFAAEEHLYHLDGLHRLIARASIARFDNEYLAEHPVEAYIAGER